jgi:glycosyltransferase involved in cell wall biosynthesis
MGEVPLISIGLPVYNGERSIRQALDSLRAQDYRHLELIISDNASTDRTAEICRAYAAADPRIQFIANERNLGLRANFGRVLELAHGPYFMWAAADDRWHSAFLSTLAEELERHPEAGLAMCATNRVRPDGTLLDTIRFAGNDDPNRQSHVRTFFGVTSPKKKKYNLFIYGLFRTALLQGAFGSFTVAPNGDRILIGVLALATRFRYVDRVLYTRLVHGSAVATGAPERSQSWEQKSQVAAVLKMGEAVFRSSLIPWHRKLLAPVGMMSLGLMLMGVWYRKRVGSQVLYYWHRLSGQPRYVR